LTNLNVYPQVPVLDLSFLRDLPNLTDLDIERLDVDTLDELVSLPRLTELWCLAEQYKPIDITALTRLPHLSELTLWSVQHNDMLFLDRLSSLKKLGLTLPQNDVDLTPLSRQCDLTHLYLDGENGALDPVLFTSMARLEHLALMTGGPILGGLAALTDNRPSLPSLLLMRMSRLGSITALESLGLRYLQINNCKQVEDLDHLQRLETLEELILVDVSLRDLAPLAALPRLKKISLSTTSRAVDLAPFSASSGLTISVPDDHMVTNEHVLPPTSKLVQRR
jgi:Leucine-rich repeat (LRR) protein